MPTTNFSEEFRLVRSLSGGYEEHQDRSDRRLGKFAVKRLSISIDSLMALAATLKIGRD